MKRGLSLVLIAVILLLTSSVALAASEYYPGVTWERVIVEAAGFNPARFEVAKQFTSFLDSIAGIVLYDGKILFEWGDLTRRGNVHSVRKSYISSLYGIYKESGSLDLTATMAKLSIDDFPPSLTETEKKATVLDLLKSRSGIYHEAAYETAAMKALRPVRGSFAPGTHWYYNNWDFNVLGTIFEKQTGTTIGQAFYDKLATSIGMQDFRVSDVSYVYESSSIHPAYPFKTTARDMARFGLLYMRNGVWEGKQVVPKEWVRESTAAYSDAGPGVGYGYLWWVAKGGLLGTELDAYAYRADGSGGQFIVVIPDYKLVVVHLSNSDVSKVDSHKSFALFMKYLLAARN